MKRHLVLSQVLAGCPVSSSGAACLRVSELEIDHEKRCSPRAGASGFTRFLVPCAAYQRSFDAGCLCPVLPRLPV